jgi:hypothetical protein
MLHRTCALASIAFALCMFAATEPLAVVLPQRTFVASFGNDGNPCSLTLPCRGFAAAVAQTTDGGEVIVLDSAGYGPVTIAQSVSIIAPAGVYAGISVSSGDGITINGSGIYVTLRGLSINGLGGGVGINIVQAAEVHVEFCVISNMVSAGLYATSGGSWIVRETAFRSNYVGVRADTTSATTAATLSMDNIETANNTFAGVLGITGSNTAATLKVTLDNSVIASTAIGNVSVFGVSFYGSAGVQASLDVSIVRTKFTAKGGGIGVSSAGSATKVTLAECHVAGWYYGAETFNGTSGVGTIQSLKNNTFISNVTDTPFPLSAVSPL